MNSLTVYGLRADKGDHTMPRARATYTAGLARAKKAGWKYADADSLQCAAAQSLGMVYCIRPEAIYDWAKRHDVDLVKQRNSFGEPEEMVLLVCVLNDTVVG